VRGVIVRDWSYVNAWLLMVLDLDDLLPQELVVLEEEVVVVGEVDRWLCDHHRQQQ
jgi:hypothetical protein